ncbi:MAG: hypothetical protein B7X65_00495 [Polaromonas sp. 39-63-25]|nr:MAG: hypothetical protein B7Y09_05275 [Polaromonas sp. 24-63-21]OZA89879.1 MAG: hypothetical protein B7X65_00495 [Polaromonas sp. 39-63-25]
MKAMVCCLSALYDAGRLAYSCPNLNTLLYRLETLLTCMHTRIMVTLAIAGARPMFLVSR